MFVLSPCFCYLYIKELDFSGVLYTFNRIISGGKLNFSYLYIKEYDTGQLEIELFVICI